MSLTRAPAARQEPYDAIPRSIQGRDDLTSGAKRLYGALSTANRTRWQPTYADLAAHLAASVRSIVRWVAQLASAGLIEVTRRGQGLTNLIRVVGLVVRARMSRPEVPKSQPRPETPPFRKKEVKNQPLSVGQCMGCKGDHPTPRCPRYGYLYRM